MDFRVGNKISLVLLVLLSAWTAGAQENVTTLGIQIKPIITSKFFGTGEITTSSEDLSVTNKPNLGVTMGMVIRRGLNKNWSFETGINLVQRNYTLTFDHPILEDKQELDFRFIGYEIPLQGMIYVRLGDKLYMNASGGVSIDLYPTDVQSQVSSRRDTLRFDFFQRTFKNSWVQVALLANYGFEYRTKEDGYFYFGASFHRPFADIAQTAVQFDINTNPTRINYALSGSYLTLDFRYFFHEDPDRKRMLKNKK